MAASIGGVVLLVLGLVVVFTLVDNRNDSSAGGNFAGSTTSSTTESPTIASPSLETPTTTAEPSTSTSTEPSTSVVERGPHKILKLADHPLLQDPRAGLANEACGLPTWRSTPAAAERYFTTALRCLDHAWRPLLEYYNLPFSSPKLNFPTGPSFRTACGTMQVGIQTAAYYCENNLYVPFAGLQTDQYGDTPGIYLALFAHEYGHHVQELAGIMDAVWDRIYTAGEHSPAGQEWSRRKELQAQCFSGMFLGSHVNYGSVTQQMFDNAWYDQETRGDDTSGTQDHGSNAHYAQWWRTGAQHNRIAQCNTFSAPSSEVS